MRITHLPTRITAQCSEHRSFWLNKREAMRKLEQLVEQYSIGVATAHAVEVLQAFSAK